jgi:hypothetical protein
MSTYNGVCSNSTRLVSRLEFGDRDFLNAYFVDSSEEIVGHFRLGKLAK